MSKNEHTADLVAGNEQGRRARLIGLAFLTLVVSVPLADLGGKAVGQDSAWKLLARDAGEAWRTGARSGPRAANRALLASFRSFEDNLADQSIARKAGAQIQGVLAHHLKSGSDQVVVGSKGWLYFRPALDYLTGPGFLEPTTLARRAASVADQEPDAQPDPLVAIRDFAAQLAERGIGLVLLPIPVKASLETEALAPELNGATPLANESFARFLGELSALGIPTYTPQAQLARERDRRRWAPFLRTDTHWTPQAMESVAENLAAFIHRIAPLPEGRHALYSRREVWARGRGDLAALISPPSQQDVSLELVRTQQVLTEGGDVWASDRSADVLLLGDSFANIYSQPEMGFGGQAGLAEHLSYFLRRPVDKIATNAGGPAEVRRRLLAELATGNDPLAGKRLVIYQFSERELSSGNWPLTPLSASFGGQSPLLRRPEEPVPARGFVVWESNRTGDWRIWTRRLEGSAPRQLSEDEPGRQHCCAHLSPDGSTLAYLSREVPADQYPELEVAGDLRLLKLDGGTARTVVEDARPYGWGNRAVIWRNDSELVYIGGDGRTFLLDTQTGRTSVLVDEPRVKLAWLVDAQARHAVNGSPSFSPYDPTAGHIDEAERWPGCEPYFSHDGRFGFWVERAGGPVRSVELATGKKGTILENLDPRIPGGQRYAYFPMLSRDGRMLAFGASAGDHDHFKSNYDIFVTPVDPTSLNLQGRPQRMTSHPASDRYPDVHVESLDIDTWGRDLPPTPVGAAPPKPPALGPLDVRVSLLVCSRTPSLREISPYRDALMVCEWEVEELLSGETDLRRLRVAHWALRDGERQPITSQGSGFGARLQLETLLGADQTQGYPVFDTLPPAPERPLLFAAGR